MSSPILNGQQLPQTSHVTNTTNHTQLQMDGMNIDNEIVIPSEAWILTGSRQASTRTRQTRVDLNRPATDTIIGSEVLNRISSARRQYSSEASNQNYNRRQTLPDSSISGKKKITRLNFSYLTVLSLFIF